MNELEKIETVRMMDSREIAELLEARHADIMLSIETQLPRVGYTAVPYTSKNQQNGQNYRYYLLPYRETMILVSGYSVELRARIVDRWLEIEKTAAPPIAIPATKAEALRLAADLEDKVDALTLELEAAGPKVEFFDAVADYDGAVPMREAAAVLNKAGWGRKNINILLRLNEVVDAKGLPYRKQQERGHFRVVERRYQTADGREQLYLVTLVTQLGLAYILKLIKDYEAA